MGGSAATGVSGCTNKRGDSKQERWTRRERQRSFAAKDGSHHHRPRSPRRSWPATSHRTPAAPVGGTPARAGRPRVTALAPACAPRGADACSRSCFQRHIRRSMRPIHANSYGWRGLSIHKIKIHLPPDLGPVSLPVHCTGRPIPVTSERSN